MLELHGVSKAFGGLRAVDDCSFTVARSRVTGLVGPNGAGKTTVFDLIAGAQPVTAGRILFHGSDITRKSPRARAHLGIGRTFQDVRLFGALSALDNVAVAVPHQAGERLPSSVLPSWSASRMERKTLERARKALAAVDFPSLRLDVVASELSYGEKKLVSIARLLVMDTALLLLDEPASGLDEESVAHLRTVVRAIVEQDRTVLIVEHDMALVRELCDWVVFLVSGGVLVEGPPEELMKSEELKELYLGTAG